MEANRNQRTYSTDVVVDYYARATRLFPAERYLFAKYVPRGADVLDVGVGGGRTSPHLSAGAKSYLGVDYSEAMIAECKKRFSNLQFETADATNLSFIPNDSIDVAVFSFNGIDNITSDAGRVACLRELARVTRRSGHVLISSHNARALASYPDFEGADFPHKVWRVARTAMQLLRGIVPTLSRRAFWKGSGYMLDPVHGGLLLHLSSPASIARDSAAAGLTVVEHVGHFYPKRVPLLLNPWNNYVLKRT